MPFKVPDLPYGYSALEPYIDEETMHFHHDKHHAAYVNMLNGAVEAAKELKRKVNLKRSNDGTFWMSISDYMKFYRYTTICKVEPGH